MSKRGDKAHSGSNNEPINFYVSSKHIRELVKARTVDQPRFEEYQIKANTRVLLVGQSGSGKSSVMARILSAGMSEDFVRRVYVCYLVDDPIYDLFRHVYNKDGKDAIQFYTMGELPPFASLKEECAGQQGSLLILDDVLGAIGPQKRKLVEYAIASRKLPMTTFIMTQRYFSLDPTIRTQCNYIILVGLIEDRALRDICQQTIGVDQLELFRRMYRVCTATKFDFLKIDLGAANDLNKMFSRGLTQFFHIHDGEDGYVRPEALRFA